MLRNDWTCRLSEHVTVVIAVDGEPSQRLVKPLSLSTVAAKGHYASLAFFAHDIEGHALEAEHADLTTVLRGLAVVDVSLTVAALTALLMTATRRLGLGGEPSFARPLFEASRTLVRPGGMGLMRTLRGQKAGVLDVPADDLDLRAQLYLVSDDMAVPLRLPTRPWRTDHGSLLLPISAIREHTVLLQLGGTPRLFEFRSDSVNTVEEFWSRHKTSRPGLPPLLLSVTDEMAARRLRQVAAAEPIAPARASIESDDVLVAGVLQKAFATGTFIAGTVHDPQRKIVSLRALDPSLVDPALDANWAHVKTTVTQQKTRLTGEGFAAFLPRRDGASHLDHAVIEVELADGSIAYCNPPRVNGSLAEVRKQLLSVIDDRLLENGGLERVFQPMLAALPVIPPRVTARLHFGATITPSTSIIVPLYRNFVHLHTQLLSLLTDPDIMERCEIIYVLDSPEDAASLDHMIRGLSLVMRLPDIQVLVLDQNVGYAAANNIAADEARGRTLILLNSDVIPLVAGWAAALERHRDATAGVGVVGPKLLYADGSLQHAGMYFERLPRSSQWQNLHFFKGYARNFPPATNTRIVPAVTGACMCLTRESFLEVGGFSTDYVIGDYEDSDLCLKLRARGASCLYAADVELYHFERQSMRLHPLRSDQGSTAYNRALHTKRWDGVIAELMAAHAQAAAS